VPAVIDRQLDAARGDPVKRLIVTAAFALTGVLPAIAQAGASLPQPIYFWGSVAATIKAPAQPPGTSQVIRPPAIAIFADGSWVVVNLRWTGWGSSVARANGVSSASNGIPNQAQGKRIRTPARVTLSNPGRFQGHEVYRCFTLTVSAPATSEHLCLTHSGGYYYLGTPAPPRTRTVEFLAPTIDGGCEMGGGGVDCETYSTAISQKVRLNGRGAVRFCSEHGTDNRCGLGNFGELTVNHRVGQQVKVGPFRCRVLRAGVQCTVIATGKGFLINKTKTVRVG
jgi:hypothetical protein